MHPKLGEAFGITFYGYGTCLVLAAPVCLLVLAILLRRRNLNLAPAVDLSILVLIGYWLGARLLYRVMSGTTGSAAGTGAWGGQIVFGGLALAYVAFARAPLRDLLDGLAVAWAFLTVPVKIGCFLSGCCHGAATDLPWAVIFPSGSACSLAGRPIHPTQLYDALAAACIGAGLAVAYHRRLARGRLLLVFLVAYGVTKFASELFRGDHRFPVAGVATASMLIEAATAIVGTLLLVRPGSWERGLAALEQRRPGEPEETPVPLGNRARILFLELGQAAIALLVAISAGAGRTWPARATAAYFAAFVVFQFLLRRWSRFTLLDRTGVAPPAIRLVTRGLLQALGTFTLVALVRPLFDRRGRTLGDSVAETNPGWSP